MCLLGVPSPRDWPVSQGGEASTSVGFALACEGVAFYGKLENKSSFATCKSCIDPSKKPCVQMRTDVV